MYKIPENMKSKYEFVTLAAKRAEQLQMGALPRVEMGPRKLTVVAQEEVAEGLVPLVDLTAEPDEITGDVEEEE